MRVDVMYGNPVLVCSCLQWLQEFPDGVRLREINTAAGRHLAETRPAVGGKPWKDAATEDILADLRRWAMLADVPAQGYVHGLDPAEEDPRRGVLE